MGQSVFSQTDVGAIYLDEFARLVESRLDQPALGALYG
jgi:hypothetical protein